MKIFSAAKIREWDAYTIENEPISSIELMNRAAKTFVDWFVRLYPDTEQPVWIFAGTGNNGGDGLAVAQLLHRAFYTAKVFVCDFSGKHSPDFQAQLDAFKTIRGIEPIETIRENEVASLVRVNQLNNADAVIIDALFGSGLSRPLEGEWVQLIDLLNGMPNEIVAIDLPSGLFADRHTDAPCIHATRTFSFQVPKLAFFFPENADRVGEWTFGSIGLHPAFGQEAKTPFHFLTGVEAGKLVRPREKFSHKGTYGHALLIAGAYGKMGAAVLAARACLRAGVGLLSVHAPGFGCDVVQTAVPEAMFLSDFEDKFWSEAPDIQAYAAVGVGPGIGTKRATADALEALLRSASKPLVLDADALNLLSEHPDWWEFVPANSILTPHPKEFERLFGKAKNDFERNDLQRQKAQEHSVFIVLKGAFTAIAEPDGNCWFNSTGNPGMATGGSGDVLTGILTGLLAQGYVPEDACRLGVFLHGLAGDLAAAERSEPALTANDIVDFLGKAWLSLGNTKLL